jgi:hypothetical protein
MSIQTSNKRAAHPSSERPTLGIDADSPFCVDAFALLDHRTRARCTPRELAPPGRYLEVEDSDQTRLLPLDRPIVHIGRGLATDIRLEDPQVSRRHAIVAQRGDGARVLDDRSRNGTFVNGRSVTIGYLTDGDILRVGRVAFRFLEIDPERTPPPPLRRLRLPSRARHQTFTDRAA